MGRVPSWDPAPVQAGSWVAGDGPEGRSSLERQGRVHGAGGRPQPRGPQEAARVEASPACPGPRSPSRASAQVRAVSLGSGGGGLGQGPCGGGALTGAPMGVSFCSLRPSAPSLWGLKTLPYAVIQADRHPHLHPPPGTLSVHPWGQSGPHHRWGQG